MILERADGPFIIHFKFWLLNRLKQSTQMKVSFGKRQPLLIKNTASQQKFIIVDIASRGQMPICLFEYLEQISELSLRDYLPGLNKQHKITLKSLEIVFNFQLLSTMESISNIYTSQRISDIQKIRYEESINDLLRSEAQFNAKYLKQIQNQTTNPTIGAEIDKQNELTSRLHAIKPVQLKWKIILFIFILFIMIGYLISRPQTKRKNKKKTKGYKK